jgi:hypothetical protein
MAPLWWNSSRSAKGYTAAQKASLKVKSLKRVERERKCERAEKKTHLGV